MAFMRSHRASRHLSRRVLWRRAFDICSDCD